MNRGLDFENCLMYEAQRRINNVQPYYQQKYNVASSDVKNVISEILDKIVEDVKPVNEFEFYSTFTKISGRAPEPKTDVIFENLTERYKCSMKWGSKYQISSAGITGTREVFSKIITNKLVETVVDEAKIKNTSDPKIKKLWNSNYDNLGHIASILAEIDDFIGDSGVREISVSKFKAKFGKGLQYALGFSKQPEPTEFYKNFKLIAIKEFLTGELTFETEPDKIANYILTAPNYKLEKITDQYIKKVSDLSKMRISYKPRPSGNEIVIRVEAKDS